MLSIDYTLSQAARDSEFIATGKRSFSSIRVLNIDETNLTPDQRAAWVAFDKAAPTSFGVRNRTDIKAISVKPPTGGAYPTKPALTTTAIEFDTAPTVDEAFAHIQRMTAEYLAASAEIARLMPEYEALAQAQRERVDAQRKADALRREQAEQAAEAARLALTVIPWDEHGKAICNLSTAIFAASGLERDSRFKSWIREITGVDKTQPNGYSFQGDWVEKQTVEIERGSRHVYLVAVTGGSRRHQTTEYRVVVMDEAGLLHTTDIATDDSDRGWALRIRDQVEALLQ